jgi:D-lactate dehydrogenase (cytochrome)
VLALRKKGGEVWTTDGMRYLRGGGGLRVVAVPISRLPELIEKSKNEFEKSGLHTTIVSHALDGNFRISSSDLTNRRRDIVSRVPFRANKKVIRQVGSRRETKSRGIGSFDGRQST